MFSSRHLSFAIVFLAFIRGDLYRLSVSFSWLYNVPLKEHTTCYASISLLGGKIDGFQFFAITVWLWLSLYTFPHAFLGSRKSTFPILTDSVDLPEGRLGNCKRSGNRLGHFASLSPSSLQISKLWLDGLLAWLYWRGCNPLRSLPTVRSCDFSPPRSGTSTRYNSCQEPQLQSGGKAIFLQVWRSCQGHFCKNTCFLFFCVIFYSSWRHLNQILCFVRVWTVGPNPGSAPSSCIIFSLFFNFFMPQFLCL